MTQATELSEEEFEERFYINGQRPVQFLLAGLAEHREPFTVSFRHGEEHFNTLLLAAPHESGKLIFDCSGSHETNRHLLAADHLLFHGRPGGIQVQFTTGRATQVIHAGASAFSTALPKFVLRLQRRESFRIHTPLSRPLIFRSITASQRLEMNTHDISCAGIGLTCNALPDGISPGTVWAQCAFSLPEEKHDFRVACQVRHITEQETRSGMQWRIGLAFDGLAHAEENRIQRYIARIEHERRETR